MPQVNVITADLEANLSQAALEVANLSRAKLDEANLEGTILAVVRAGFGGRPRRGTTC